MKVRILSGMCLSLCALPIVAMAGEVSGGKEGHGGVSIVCRTPSDAIKSVELLDTFEGNNQYNLKIGGSALPPEDQVEQAQTRLASRPDLLDEFQTELANVQAHIQFLKGEVGLNPTDDAFPVIKKKSCRYEQLAVYTDSGQVLVDSELYGFLSTTDQAALYVHETIFKMARSRGETSSVTSRKLTAYMFTRPNQPNVTKELLASMFPPPAPPAPLPKPPVTDWVRMLRDGMYTDNGSWCDIQITTVGSTHLFATFADNCTISHSAKLYFNLGHQASYASSGYCDLLLNQIEIIDANTFVATALQKNGSTCSSTVAAMVVYHHQ